MSVSTARLLSIALLALAACASRPSPTGVAVDPQVDEPSGLVASATHPGVYWTHGDSGNGNWLFAIDAEGKLLARYRVAATENVDWEDIAHAEQGRLWLGDIGNNDSGRRDLAVHRLPAPDPRAGVGQVARPLGAPADCKGHSSNGA
ncbi:MAG: hypothetical protein KC457_27000, partial [Myxococcales bacterium]|nr:hypothetical protein [Myxococcales bacterium]